jgi:hypothetical protein
MLLTLPVPMLLQIFFPYSCAVLRIRISSLIFIHPGSKSSSKRGGGGGGNLFCPTIFCSHKYHKIQKNFSFEQVKFLFFAKTVVLFIQKIFSLSCQKYGFGIWDPEKNYSGSRIQGKKGTGTRIRIRNTVLL